MREIFDPNGNATVILLATHFRSNLQRLSTLKARLKVRAAAHYQVHSKQGSLLGNLLSMRRELHHIKSQGPSGPQFILLILYCLAVTFIPMTFLGSTSKEVCSMAFGSQGKTFQRSMMFLGYFGKCKAHSERRSKE